MNRVYLVEGLCCPVCSQKIEGAIRKIKEVSHASINFMTLELNVGYENLVEEEFLTKANREAYAIDTEVRVTHSHESVVGVKPHLHEEGCACGQDHQGHHHHGHDHGYHPEERVEGEDFQRNETAKTGESVRGMVAGGVLFFCAVALQGIFPVTLWLLLPSYLLLGWNVAKSALINLMHGRVMDENFLMFVATLGAACTGDYPEAAAVMLFYRVGEHFQDRAVSNSRKSIQALLSILPQTATVLREEGEVRVAPQAVSVGESIFVRPGEMVPLDGVIVAGESFFDTSNITGESVPRKGRIGDSALSGYLNQEGAVTLKVTAGFEESAVSKVMKLTRQAANNKAETEKFITKFSKVYTPAVVGAAALIGVVPPLFFGAGWSVFLHKALSFLVISCPCALVISVPMAYFAGIGKSAERGLYLKGGPSIDAMGTVEMAAFDKTGTLTNGTFTVVEMVPVKGVTEETLLQMAASCEVHSNHPIARSIAGRFIGTYLSVSGYQELSGKGVLAFIEGERVCCGSTRWMEEMGIHTEGEDTSGAVVHVAKGENYLGRLVVADGVKEDAAGMLSKLKALGIKRTVMLTGDRKQVALAIAKGLAVDEVKSDLLPEDKLTALSGLQKNGKVLYVGDGINDAPVLMGADMGIAIGTIGQDAAIESADGVLITDTLSSIVDGLVVARFTRKIVVENILLSLGIKAAVLGLALVVTLPIVVAVFADVGVALLAVLNSMRILRMKKFG